MRTPHTTHAVETAVTTASQTLFTVTSYGAHGERLYSTLPLNSAESAARWHDDLADKPATQRITIVANTIERTERLITSAELPGTGEPTPQPKLPPHAHTARRFYRFSSGPAVLRTGDDARHWLKRTTEAQRCPTPHTVLVDLDQLRLYEVTLIEHARMLTYAELATLT